MGSLVAVAAVVVTVVIVSGGNDATGIDKSKPSTGVTAEVAGKAKAAVATPAMQRKIRPSRMYNGRRLPDMPLPSARKRHDMAPQPGDQKGSTADGSCNAGGKAAFDQNQNRGGQSIQNVINRARSLRAEGREEDAKKLLRNAMMIEPNPYSRKVLLQEMNPTTKSADPAVPATGTAPAPKPATMPIPAPASKR